MKNQSCRCLFLSLFITVITACGGGGGDSASGNTTGEAVKTGVFFDNLVTNIGYRTETLEGVTNSLGEYEYLTGETITFFIGDLEFPTVMATGTVTPLDLAGTQDIADPVVVNIIRLLQTLDQDGDPDNGIIITDLAKSSAAQVDFGLSEADFASSLEVINLIANAGQDNIVIQLVNSVEAVAHFEQGLSDNGISFESIGKNVSGITSTGGSISPTGLAVNYGATTDFTVTPDSGYSLDGVSGCGGTLSGNTFTTGAVTAVCTVSASFSLNSYQVSVSAGTGGSISPTGLAVNHGATTDFTVTADSGYSLDNVSGCGGTLSGNTFTTGAVTAVCTVSASFSLNSYQVSVSAGTGGSISPTGLAVNHGATTDFTVTADSGYSLDDVSGCGGTLSGNTFTTGAVTAVCTVSASFSLNSYQVSVSAGTGGSISPTGLAVNHGATTDFTVTADSGYSLDGVSGCGGTLSGNTFTTGAVTAVCTVSASFSLNSYQVSVSAGTGGSISPTGLAVNHGATTDFTVTADSGYSLDNVSGCGGTLSGNTFTTGAVTAVCTVSASFSLNSYQVSVNAGTGGSISPTGLAVNHGATTDFTVTADSGYSLDGVSGCGGTLSGNTFTTGAVTAVCTVSASFSLNSYQVSVSAGTGGSISPTGLAVNHGATTDFTVTADSGYSLDNVSGCGGTLSGNTFTTGAVTAVCTVSASFSLNSYQVSVNAGTGGSISPTGLAVNHGATTDFTVTADSGYSLDGVSGCGGTLSGNTFTTGAVTAVCTVSASFSLNSYQVSVSAGTGGSISPTGLAVNHGATTDFTVTADSGYSLDNVSGCGGTLSGNTFTTGAVTAVCTVSASFSLNSYQVSVSAGTGGSISPTGLAVNHGATTDFTVTADSGYSLDDVSGCGGTLSGNTFTTGAVTAVCTVSASFSLNYNYYVCSTGSDTNDGLSHATAWKTYAKANSMFSSLYGGDSILFCKGEEFLISGSSFWINYNSTSMNRVTISSYTPPNAASNIANPTIYATGGESAFKLVEGSGVHDEGYVISNLILKGDGTGGNGILVYNDSDFIDIIEVEIYDYSIGIYISGSNAANGDSDGRNSDIKVKRAYIHDNEGMGFLGGSDNLVIEDSVFVNNGFEGPTFFHSIYLNNSGGAVSNEIIRNNKIYQSAMYGGKCSGVSLVVHTNHTNLLIENNVIWEDIGTAVPGCGGIGVDWGHAGEKFEQFPGLIIRGNTVVNMGPTAIGCALCPDAIIENNTIVQQNATYSMFGIVVPIKPENFLTGLPQSDNVLVRNNTILYHSPSIGTGIRLGDGDGSTYSSTGNNIYYSPGSGMVAGCESYPDSPPDLINVSGGICQNSIPQELLSDALAKTVLTE